MTDPRIIHTDRIALRNTTEADLEQVLKMERDTENSRFIRHWPPEQHNAAMADTNIAHLIVETMAEGNIVGYIILIGVENPDLSLEFKRIVIGEKARGYGREAVRLIKRYAFENLGLHRLWLEVMDFNSRAFELYKSEGFILEGTHRGAVKQGETYASLHVMSMLAEEYEAASTKPKS